jgi:SAM-dependent methyltransferase
VVASDVLAADFDYIGNELQLFAAADNWKRYWAGAIAPFVRGRVLDVGAGLGATARAFAEHRGISDWSCLEPDRRLARALRVTMAEYGLPFRTRVRCGMLADLHPTEHFDAVLYIDVLEHIRDDGGELARAAAHIAKGGHLVVLSPAHQWLYSPFDQAIGHERRYTRESLRASAPADLRLVRLHYLDAVGLAASLGNRLLLRRAMPSAVQIAAWDRLMVPLSRRVDPLIGHSLGKTVIGVWTR